MPCYKDSSRIDKNGKAFAGSQRQIQQYVNEQSEGLSAAVMQALDLPHSSRIVWVSPLASDSYNEYRDTEFLDVLGLARLNQLLKDFWPRGGPCWDALARIETDSDDAYVLLEAKSHIKEIFGGGCRADGDSLLRIENALNKTKQWLGVPSSANWLGRLYQSANRYAHLYFLREVGRVDAYLINLYFVGDPHSPTQISQWQEAINAVQRELGLPSQAPFSNDLILSCAR